MVALWAERYGSFFGTYQTTASLSLVPNCEEGARAVFYLTTSQKRKTPSSRCQREQIKISSFVCVVVNLFLYLYQQILSSFFLNIARGSFFFVCASAVKNPMQVHFSCFCRPIGGSFFRFKGLIFNIFSWDRQVRSEFRHSTAVDHPFFNNIRFDFVTLIAQLWLNVFCLRSQNELKDFHSALQISQ